MESKKTSFLEKYGSWAAFLVIIALGWLLAYFLSAEKYGMLEGQEVVIQAGRPILGIGIGVASLVIAFIISRRL